MAQRAELPAPDAPLRRWSRGVRLPEGGHLPQSKAWLDRLHAEHFVPIERKAQVLDPRRCIGPWMVTVDESPMVLLDACSQIATLTHGFASNPLLRAVYEGHFDEVLWANPTTREGHPILEQYGQALLAAAPAGLRYASFLTAGGAEANEKAMRLARLSFGAGEATQKRRRVLAFENSFHGRTFASLMATWNPEKRAAFELEGYQAIFAPTDLEVLEKLLQERHEELYAVLLEPMQAEGGDVHLAAAFAQGVRALTRRFGLPLIVDEVQTGFFTGGQFFWWKRFGLGEDEASSPDLLTCAKKAGTGVVLSRWPDPEPVDVSLASALRGYIQLQHAAEQGAVEQVMVSHLMELAARFDIVKSPRYAGTTFAFDLPSAAMRDALMAQRIARGFWTYPAGDLTIRFRLGAHWKRHELDDLFARIGQALVRIDQPSAAVVEAEGASPPKPRAPVHIRPVEEADYAELMHIQRRVYEPERVDPESKLRRAAETGLGLVAQDVATKQILGFSFAGPLEEFAEVPGPATDPALGSKTAVYSADLAVIPEAQGRGVGRLLKEAQLHWATEQGYRWICGRNRVGHTEEMARLNASLGAYVHARLEGQYGGHGQADYYRIPLKGLHEPSGERRPLDFASGLQSPLGPSPRALADREWVGPLASRVNMSNWATPDVVQYVEHLRMMRPRAMKHMYFTSSRDEMVDKGLRCLRLSRPRAQTAIGLRGGYVGHTTAAARSLSDSDGFAAPFGLFDWPHVPHPSLDAEGFEKAAEAWVARVGADSVLAIVAELVQERTGVVLDEAAASRLAAFAKRHDIPLVYVETCSGGYRNGHGAWASDGLSDAAQPDMVLWYPGGQVGHVLTNERYFWAKPLTLISTWDGDEVSSIRAHEVLRAAHRLDLAPAIAALGSLLTQACGKLEPIGGAVLGGLGLYRTLTLRDAATAQRLRDACSQRGLLLGTGAPGVLTLVPALDIEASEIEGVVREALEAAIAAVCAGA